MSIDSDTLVEVATNRVNVDEVSLRIDSDISVEVVTIGVCVVGHKFILSDLKKLAHYFGIRWYFCSLRSVMAIKCNRATRFGSRDSLL